MLWVLIRLAEAVLLSIHNMFLRKIIENYRGAILMSTHNICFYGEL